MIYSYSCLSPHSLPSFFLTHLCFPLFFWFTDKLPPPLPFLGYCLYFPLCGSVGNSAFPVILLVGWFCVDFVQTVGSALREGLVLDLQSLPIILSSFKQPTDNRQPPSATPATHKANHCHIVGGLIVRKLERGTKGCMFIMMVSFSNLFKFLPHIFYYLLIHHHQC